MSIVLSEKEVAEYYRRQGREPPAIIKPKSNRRTKYGNKRIETVEGYFDSKHEEKCWQEIKGRLMAGEILGVGRQVWFSLPGGIKYIADFVTLEKDGSYNVYDAKSPATKKDKAYRIKRKQMKECNGIEIIEI